MSRRVVHKVYTKKEQVPAIIITCVVVIALSVILAFGTINFCNEFSEFLSSIA